QLVIEQDLPRAVAGELTAVQQDHPNATHAPPLTREDGAIPWTESTRAVANRVRGVTPRPGAHTTLGGKAVKVLSIRAVTGEGPAAVPGTVVRADKGGIYVATADGAVELVTAQLAGKKPASGRDLVNGRVVKLGDAFGT